MRTFVRIFTFSCISLLATQQIVGGFDFGNRIAEGFFLLALGLTLLNIFIVPVFRVISLPSQGLGFLILNFLITLITIYVLISFIPFFSVTAATITELVILGVRLPSKYLTPIWSLVFSSLLFSVILSLFNWICPRR